MFLCFLLIRTHTGVWTPDPSLLRLWNDIWPKGWFDIRWARYFIFFTLHMLCNWVKHRAWVGSGHKMPASSLSGSVSSLSGSDLIKQKTAFRAAIHNPHSFNNQITLWVQWLGQGFPVGVLSLLAHLSTHTISKLILFPSGGDSVKSFWGIWAKSLIHSTCHQHTEPQFCQNPLNNSSFI